MSNVSPSIAWANLRRKKRRLQVAGASQSAASLDGQYLEESFRDEIRKKEYFQYFSLPWPTSPSSEKLSLEQGGFVMDRRLRDLSLTVSPSQRETPKDGNCLFHSLLDQLRYNSELHDFAEDHEEFRTKVVTYGYDKFLKTKKLTWSGDPELGSPKEWRRNMLQLGVYGDEVALTLASNVLGVDIVIIPAFRESSVHPGLGITVIKSIKKPQYDPLYMFLFSESDFKEPHYQSVRPIDDDNVLVTFLKENLEIRDCNMTEASCLELTEESLDNIPVDVIDESRQMWSAVEVSQESFQQVVVMSSDSFQR